MYPCACRTMFPAVINIHPQHRIQTVALVHLNMCQYHIFSQLFVPVLSKYFPVSLLCTNNCTCISFALFVPADVWKRQRTWRSGAKVTWHQLCIRGQKQTHLPCDWCSSLVPLYLFGHSGRCCKAPLPFLDASCCTSRVMSELPLWCSIVWQHLGRRSRSLSSFLRGCAFSMIGWPRVTSLTVFSSSRACVPCCRWPLASGKMDYPTTHHSGTVDVAP